MKVRAMFQCTGVRKYKGWGGHEFLYEAEFGAVTDGSEEAKKFFAATPSGSVKLSSYLPDAFEVGKTYYLDFTPVDPE